MPGNNPWANVTPEKYDEWCANLSASQKARWDSYTPERRAEIGQNVRAADGRHAECDHEATPAARTRCRRARARREAAQS